jgi:hypothetical protein
MNCRGRATKFKAGLVLGLQDAEQYNQHPIRRRYENSAFLSADQALIAPRAMNQEQS